MALDPRITTMPDGSKFYSGSAVNKPRSFESSNIEHNIYGRRYWEGDNNGPSSYLQKLGTLEARRTYYMSSHIGQNMLVVDTTNPGCRLEVGYKDIRDTSNPHPNMYWFQREISPNVSLTSLASDFLVGNTNLTLYNGTVEVRGKGSNRPPIHLGHAHNGPGIVIGGITGGEDSCILHKLSHHHWYSNIGIFPVFGTRIGQLGIGGWLGFSCEQETAEILGPHSQLYSLMFGALESLFNSLSERQALLRSLCRQLLMGENQKAFWYHYNGFYYSENIYGGSIVIRVYPDRHIERPIGY